MPPLVGGIFIATVRYSGARFVKFSEYPLKLEKISKFKYNIIRKERELSEEHSHKFSFFLLKLKSCVYVTIVLAYPHHCDVYKQKIRHIICIFAQMMCLTVNLK